MILSLSLLVLANARCIFLDTFVLRAEDEPLHAVKRATSREPTTLMNAIRSPIRVEPPQLLSPSG